MRPKSMVLILIALGCGLVATIGVSQVMKNRNGEKAEDTESVVLVIENIDLGQALTNEVVQLEQWPRDSIPTGAVRSLEEVEGKYARQYLYPGEPLLAEKMMDSSQDDSARIEKGYRVKAVKVTDQSAVGNLIKPGDRVDVIAFLKSRDVVGERTKTILRNIRVFAVNSLTSRQSNTEGEEGAIDAKTVSLLVKPSQVQLLVLAEGLGRIELSLRHPNDPKDDSTDEPTTLEALLGDNAKADVASDQKPTGLLPFFEDRDTTAPAESGRRGAANPNGGDDAQFGDDVAMERCGAIADHGGSAIARLAAPPGARRDNFEPRGIGGRELFGRAPAWRVFNSWRELAACPWRRAPARSPIPEPRSATRLRVSS